MRKIANIDRNKKSGSLFEHPIHIQHNNKLEPITLNFVPVANSKPSQ